MVSAKERKYCEQLARAGTYRPTRFKDGKSCAGKDPRATLRVMEGNLKMPEPESSAATAAQTVPSASIPRGD